VQAAEALSQSRQRYAEELGAKVSASMHELAMPDGRFAIEVRPDAQSSLSPLGIDRVEFMVTTNPGQPIQPLGKVASGGELSRISLAIVVISARKISTPTLIFDEVDVGSAARPPPWWAPVAPARRIHPGDGGHHLPQVAGRVTSTWW
jgi:DNA repair protein RecN (Recombination protein N)